MVFLHPTRCVLAHSAPWMKKSKFANKPAAEAVKEGVVLLLTGTLHGARCPGWTRLKVSAAGYEGNTTDKVVAAACGMNHAGFVMASGGLMTLGDNRQGQCGRPLERDVYAPSSGKSSYYFPPRAHTAAAGSDAGADALAFGARHSFLYKKGTRYVRVAGQNEFHQLGLGVDFHHDISDVDDGWGYEFGIDWGPALAHVPAEEGGVVKITTGSTHSLALFESGAVYAFGCALDGPLGTGNTIARNTPFRIKFFAAQKLCVTDVVAGHACSMFVTDRGVYGAGKLDEGRLALEWTRKKPVALLPAKMPLPFHPTLIDGGLSHGIIVDDNRSWCVFGGAQKLGMSSLMCKDSADIVHHRRGQQVDFANNPHIPRPLPPLPAPVRSLSCGSHHTLALTTDGRVIGSGFGADGQLGPDVTDALTTSEEIMHNPSIAAVAAGGSFSVVAINVTPETPDTWSQLPVMEV